MQDTPSPKKPKNFFKERFLRFSIVIFLKKNWLIFSLILIFLLSIFLGFWNIRSYEIFSMNVDNIPEQRLKDIQGYIDKNIIGRNFFTIYPKNFEKEMENSLAYVEYIRIEKKFPNKIAVLLRIYDQDIVAYTKNESCYLLSKKGVVLEKICEDNSFECCLTYAKESSKPFLIAPEIDVVDSPNSKKRLLVMDNIDKFLELIKKFGYMVTEISFDNNIVKVKDSEERLTIFSLVEDLTIQLQRYYIVMGKIRQDEINWESVDIRFERPVMKIR